ncbi:SIR2 family NAD-dependent protein deacylase [Christiangramia forsetii]|uniref:NAD-dependent protein deacylase n=2 Tax=Christiangramia forsetii TaxID=411153 RepID=A0M0C3_CHRFK|nr:NAD-dependent deacylase [Christiangramia forsetii]GGG41272.1 NAD-dependent protein deacylase [Christiangramia forsetii]CAL66068.1 NAD-dependent deacetylase [Christiangramia forsetii KT0803]
MKRIVVLTGAGISAESGIKTFRDENGLWEGHDVMEVASPLGWKNNIELVLDFYNQRRKQLLQVKPNAAHQALVKLQQAYDVQIITQNIDDLHERAGSSKVTHLHGELLKARSSFDENLVMDWKKDIKVGDFCEHNFQLRPHVVWFGEAVPMFQKAAEIAETADIVIVIGTSMQVYPAAGLVDFVPRSSPIYFIDPKPNISESKNLEIIKKTAVKGVPELIERLLNE